MNLRHLYIHLERAAWEHHFDASLYRAVVSWSFALPHLAILPVCSLQGFGAPPARAKRREPPTQSAVLLLDIRHGFPPGASGHRPKLHGLPDQDDRLLRDAGSLPGM
jgi:hypothetical protein